MHQVLHLGILWLNADSCTLWELQRQAPLALLPSLAFHSQHCRHDNLPAAICTTAPCALLQPEAPLQHIRASYALNSVFYPFLRRRVTQSSLNVLAAKQDLQASYDHVAGVRQG